MWTLRAKLYIYNTHSKLRDHTASAIICEMPNFLYCRNVYATGSLCIQWQAVNNFNSLTNALGLATATHHPEPHTRRCSAHHLHHHQIACARVFRSQTRFLLCIWSITRSGPRQNAWLMNLSGAERGGVGGDRERAQKRRGCLIYREVCARACARTGRMLCANDTLVRGARTRTTYNPETWSSFMMSFFFRHAHAQRISGSYFACVCM